MSPQVNLWGISPAAAKRNVAAAQIYALRLGALILVAIILLLIYRATAPLPWYIDAPLAVAVAFAWAWKFERRPR